MLQSELGLTISSWSAKSKADVKADLDKLTLAPPDILRLLADKIAKTHPCCNIHELAAIEAEQRGIPDGKALADALSVFTYILTRADGDSPSAVTSDLVSLGLLSQEAAPILNDLLVAAEPYRESASAAAANLRIGSPLFVNLRGTVDIRLRFHRTSEEIVAGSDPTGLLGAQQVILANLTINNPGDEESVIGFLMDENDLKYMKRFVRNMEEALRLSKKMLSPSEQKENG